MSSNTSIRRHMTWLALAAGISGAGVGLLAGPAQARPNPPTWSVSYYDFDGSSLSHTFIFGNGSLVPLVDKPAPFKTGAFSVLRDTCTTFVAPGATCQVAVGYKPTGQPVADRLQLQFNDPSGAPVATPPVQLFGGGAEYVATSHQNGLWAFPPVPKPIPGSPWKTETISIPFFRHGPGSPVDLPPDLKSPFSVVSNSCTKVLEKSCAVVVGFAPSAPGQFVGDFQMTFEDSVTGASVPAQDVTLEATAN